MKFQKIIIVLFVILLISSISSEIGAQCPMCRMSAESNLANGGTDGKGLNAGILYLLALPYIMVAGLGYWWWKNKRSEEDQEIANLLDS